MAGTHYTLDRDKVENQNPMDLIKEKACRTCKAVKPNTFQFFGKKLWKTRHDLTTNEVCIACQKAKVSASMKARWRERKTDDAAYQAEQLRMAISLNAANQAVRDKAEAKAVEAERERLDYNPEIRPIGLSDAVDFTGSEAERVHQSVETRPVGRPPLDRVETPSEILAREMMK